jgi:hypothetical protein
MLHKCANPACVNPFRKLSEGKLFLLEMESPSSSSQQRRYGDGRRPHRIEHFWLCDQCASVLTLAFEKGKGMIAVPLCPPERKPQASVRLAEVAGDTAREDGARY